eukprot:Hpha_TRINITY_DN1427_c0_g1::TRINITY_DN1427_c0_g1_i1::g.9575::m.9575
MQLRCPAKLLLVLATSFSTAVSFVGGFILYLESVNAIEATVRDGALSEIALAAYPIQREIFDAKTIGEQVGAVVSNWQEPFKTPEDFVRYNLVDGFARLNTTNAYCAGLVAIFNYSKCPEHCSVAKSSLWWDPLTDPTAIEDNGGDRFYVQGYTAPSMSGVPCVNGSISPQCNAGWEIDRSTGELSEHAYNYTFVVKDDYYPEGDLLRSQPNFMTEGASVWDRMWVWLSYDQTPYQYGHFLSIRPLSYNNPNPLLDDTLVVGWGMFLTHEWPDILLSLNLQGYVMVVNGGIELLASNTGQRMLTTECQSARDEGLNSGSSSDLHPCSLRVSDQPPAPRAAVAALLNARDEDFIRRELDGEDYWILRKTIFRPSRHDKLDTIFLVWMRHVSSVEDQVLRSLFFFIGFISAVLVFDCFVVFLEIRKIGQPLGTLRRAVNFIDKMDLDSAVEELDTQAVGGVFAISDIQELWVSFYHTIKCLREYRSFLPHAVLLEDHSDEDEPLAQEESVESEASSQGTLKSSNKNPSNHSGDQAKQSNPLIPGASPRTSRMVRSPSHSSTGSRFNK